MAFDKNNPNNKQAGAELGQAQPQLGLRLTSTVIKIHNFDKIHKEKSHKEEKINHTRSC